METYTVRVILRPRRNSDNARMEEIDDTSSSVANSIDIPSNQPWKSKTRARIGSRNNYDWGASEDHYSVHSFDDDYLLDLERRGNAAVWVDRTQDDLDQFRRRIDSNVERQREYREMMAALQNKVRDYRKVVSELEGKGGAVDVAGLKDPKTGALIENFDRDLEVWSAMRGRLGSGTAATFPGAVLAGDLNAQYQMIGKFEEEHRRAEDFRSQLERERAERDRLSAEYETVRDEFERFRRDYVHHQREFENREKNLNQNLSDEQQKMMDMWAELQRVRKQFTDMKEKMESELSQQKSEFEKTLQNVETFNKNIITPAFAGGGANSSAVELLLQQARSGGTSHEIDNTIIDVVRRMKTGTEGADVSGFEGSELQKDIMIKFESAVERNVELEAIADENQRKVAELEAELRRTKEKLSDSSHFLSQLYRLGQEGDNATVTGKRTRSISPGHNQLPPAEVYRVVRGAFRAKDSELHDFESRWNSAEQRVKELQGKFETADSNRLRLDKLLSDANREMASMRKSFEDVESNHRRLQEKLTWTENELASSEQMRKSLEEQLNNMRMSSQKTEEIKVTKVQMDDRAVGLEQDFRSRADDLNRRIETLRKENNKLKAEMTPMKDRIRDLETMNNSAERLLKEKDAQIEHIDNQRSDLQREMEQHRSNFEIYRSTHEKLTIEMENVVKNLNSAEQQLKELKTQRDDFQKQKDDLNRQLQEVKNVLENERSMKQNVERTSAKTSEEIDRFKQTIKDYEQQVRSLRQNNADFDTTIKNQQGQIVKQENEIHSKSGELSKLNDLNQKLQKEKEFVLVEKHTMESDWNEFKDRTRKLENELNKVRKELKVALDNEQRIRQSEQQHAKHRDELRIGMDVLNHELQILRDRCKSLEGELEQARQRQGDVSQDISDTSIRREVTIPVGAAPGEQKVETEDDLLFNLRVNQISDKWRIRVEELENENEELQRRIKDMSNKITDRKWADEQFDSEISNMKRDHNIEIENLQLEMRNLRDKCLTELDDEKEQNEKIIANLKATENQLREKIVSLETYLAEATNRETELERERSDTQEQLKSVQSHCSKLQSEIENLRRQYDKDVQKWKNECLSAQSELNTLKNTNSSLEAQLRTSSDQITSLNRTVDESTNKIRNLTSEIRRLEENLAGTNAELDHQNSEFETTSERLRLVEDQFEQLQEDSSTWRTDLNSALRENDSLKSWQKNHIANHEMIVNKLKSTEEQLKEAKNNLGLVRNEKEKLQNNYRDRAKQIEQLQQHSQQLEEKLQKLRAEWNSTNDKLNESDRERSSLRIEVERLREESKFAKEQMQRKSEEFDRILNELSNAYREAEDGRLNATKELELHKYEVNDLTARLENNEQRLIGLQQEFINADSERDILSDALRRFQSSASRVMNINRFRRGVMGAEGDEGEEVEISPPQYMEVDQATPGEAGFGESGDSRVFKSVAGSTVVNINEGMDFHQLESSLHQLLNRIEQLENERNKLRDVVNSMKERSGEIHLSSSKHESNFRVIEQNLLVAQEEKRGLESRLASAKQLLISQDESLKQRDEEKRQMKAKVVAAELDARGKEAQIKHMNEQLRKMRIDLDSTFADSRVWREKKESLDSLRIQLEGKLREQEAENRKLHITVTSFGNERQMFENRTKELKDALRASEIRVQDLQSETEKLRRNLSNAEKAEFELRQSLDRQIKLTDEQEVLKTQFVQLQMDANSHSTRRQQLESELSAAKNEIRDYKQRMNDVNTRVDELQRQLQESNSERSRVEEKLHSSKKIVNEQKRVEKELRSRIDEAITEKKKLAKELDDYKFRLSELEEARRSFNQQVEDWKREKQSLLKTIETLDYDKHRTEVAVKEMSLQREAIEKSLNAMEKENKELYKSCAELQKQIAQLEIENGNRIMELTSKQRDEQEAQLRRIAQDKQQMENIIESRQKSDKNRIRQLEEQMSMLRDQLDAERRRRREQIDRPLMHSVSRSPGSNILSGRYSGIGGYGSDSSRMYGFGGEPRSSFTFSSPASPPQYSSAPTPPRMGRIEIPRFDRFKGFSATSYPSDGKVEPKEEPKDEVKVVQASQGEVQTTSQKKE